MPHPHTANAARTRLRAEELETRLTPAVAVRFDYSLDTSGFFNDPVRRADLERVAATVAPRLHDDLAAITPSGPNTWTATVFNPATNQTVSLPNLAVREGEVVVYIGATKLGAAELGLTTSGGYTASGTRSWLDTVRARGQVGATGDAPTDFATWGGMITFDTAANWHFGPSAPPASQFDFESVAAHELLHVFGFGLGLPAFARNVTNWNGSSGQFAGPTAVAVYGKPVPVVGDADGPDHLAPGVSYRGQPSPIQPALPPGQRRTVSDLELAVLQDIGWEVFTGPATDTAQTPAPAPVSAAPATAAGRRFAVGTASGVAVYGANGDLVATARPLDPGPGGTRVASADLTGDGTPDLIAGTGPGPGNLVSVSDGRTGVQLVAFQPFEGSFTGGVFVATGDLTGDGKPDLVVTADDGGGPVVAVFDGASLARGQVVQTARFLGIDDPNFRGGARPGVGDVNGDGKPDLVIAAGTGGGPRVAVWDGMSVRAGRPAHLVADFFAFEPGLRNGTFVAAADLDGDGAAELVVGAGPGGGPRVVAFSGRQLLAGRQATVADFFAGSPDSRGGARVATADLDGDGRPDVVVGAGGQASVYRGRDLGRGVATPALNLVPPGDTGAGVFVG